MDLLQTSGAGPATSTQQPAQHPAPALDNQHQHPSTQHPAISLRYAPDGRLHAVANGVEVAVRLRQCFPWSQPTQYVSLRDDDEEEVALVSDASALDTESRQALEQALAEAGFVLEVVRVLEIEEEVEIRQWTVETKQGRRLFQTHLDDWPRVLPNGGLLIRDVSGDLYMLADPKRMDKQTRALLWAFVD